MFRSAFSLWVSLTTLNELVARDGQPELQENIDLFSKVGGEPDRTKGILRVKL
jgi:hypothetical protein